MFMRSVFWLTCTVMAILSLLPSEQMPQIFNFWDKAQHAIAFFAISVVGFSTFPSAIFRVSSGLLVYGVGIELAQAATGWRSGDWQDWMADVLGVGAAHLVWFFTMFLKNRFNTV